MMFWLSLALVLQYGTITVAWDRPADPPQGYYVYVGEQPGVYTRIFHALDAYQWSFYEAQLGVRYYFAVSAYVTDAEMGTVEGPKSAEVSAVVGEAPPPGLPTPRPVIVRIP